MSGPEKEFTIKLLIPVSAEMRDHLKAVVGKRKMAAVIRELIGKYIVEMECNDECKVESE